MKEWLYLKPARVLSREPSHAQLFGTPWTLARQAPLSMEFSRQEYWGGLPSPTPGEKPAQEYAVLMLKTRVASV